MSTAIESARLRPLICDWVSRLVFASKNILPQTIFWVTDAATNQFVYARFWNLELAWLQFSVLFRIAKRLTKKFIRSKSKTDNELAKIRQRFAARRKCFGDRSSRPIFNAPLHLFEIGDTRKVQQLQKCFESESNLLIETESECVWWIFSWLQC